MDREVTNIIIEEEQKMIQKIVYNPYHPTHYERREHRGGLIARENIKNQFYKTGSDIKISMSVDNLTKMDRDSSQYLAPLVVLGHLKAYNAGIGDKTLIYGANIPWRGGYNEYPRYNAVVNSSAYYGESRDFISATRKYIYDNDFHKSAMRAGLRRQGVKVK